MEKDSCSDGSVNEETKEEKSEHNSDSNESAEDNQQQLIESDEQLLHKREQLIQELNEEKKEISHVAQIIASEKAFPSSDRNFPISVIDCSHFLKSTGLMQTLLETPDQHHPPFSQENLHQPAIIIDVGDAEDYTKQIHSVYTPPDTSDDDSNDFVDLEESHGSKGKEAKNPNFRYVKRSKPEVSETEVSKQIIPVKPLEKATGTPETSGLEIQSSKTENIRIFPAVKRKNSDLDESCGTTSIDSENRADNNKDANLSKKVKSDDYETLWNHYSTITGLLNCIIDNENFESSKCIDQSQTDHSYSDLKPSVPPPSDIKEISCATSSTDPSLFTDNDQPRNEKENSSIASGSEEDSQIDQARMELGNNPPVVQSQTDKSCSDLELLAVPSTSGIKAISSVSSREESTTVSSNDDQSRSEREVSSGTSGGEECVQSEPRHPVLMSFMNNPMIGNVPGIYSLDDMVAIFRSQVAEQSHSDNEDS